MKGMNTRFHSLRRSFACAASGIAFCVRYERNMRIHLVVFAYVMFAAIAFYEFTRAELILLILTCTNVMSLEIVNTAIEVLTDKASPERSALAKVAKDAAAGAVLMSALAAATVGLILFGDLSRFAEILDFFNKNILATVALAVSVVISIIFVFTGKERQRRGKTK
jgi:diacylglycerol kinase (ATP)